MHLFDNTWSHSMGRHMQNIHAWYSRGGATDNSTQYQWFGKDITILAPSLDVPAGGKRSLASTNTLVSGTHTMRYSSWKMGSYQSAIFAVCARPTLMDIIIRLPVEKGNNGNNTRSKGINKQEQDVLFSRSMESRSRRYRNFYTLDD